MSSPSRATKTSPSHGQHRTYYVEKIKAVLAKLNVNQKVFSKDDITILNHCLTLSERVNGQIDENFQLPTNAVQPLTIALKDPYALLAVLVLQELEKGANLPEQSRQYYEPAGSVVKREAYSELLAMLLPNSAAVTSVYGEYLTLLKLAKMVLSSAQPPASPTAGDDDDDGGSSPAIIPSKREVEAAQTRSSNDWKERVNKDSLYTHRERIRATATTSTAGDDADMCDQTQLSN
jgi:hypothetical protein